MARMTSSTFQLSDRAVLSITGKDTHDFLQRVITTDMSGLEPGEIRAGALLTPQGKILVDFLIHSRQDGVWIDVWQEAADSLLKRLTLYRLRAEAQIELAGDRTVVVGTGHPDPRSDALPARAVLEPGDRPDGAAGQAKLEIAAGVPAFGRDYGEADVFPTDVNLDLYGGIGWKKGCFIGQEVLSRMKRRGTIRKRSARISGPAARWSVGVDLVAGELTIGQLTSVDQSHAIARIRTDRLEKADAALTVDGAQVELDLPGKD